jgi:hypothetical protein
MIRGQMGIPKHQIMRSAVGLNSIQGVDANMAMEATIERVLKISPFLLLAIFELFSKLLVVLIKIHLQMIQNVVKKNPS